METKKRFLVLVQAGSKDWEPSAAELNDISGLYKEALDEIYPKGEKVNYAIIVVRNDISTQMYDLSTAAVSTRGARETRKLILKALGKKKSKNSGKMTILDFS
jgi:hypothetical protein